MDKKPIYLFLLFYIQAIIHCDNLVVAQLPRPENVISRCKKGDFKSDAYSKHLDFALDSLSSSIGNPEYTGFKSTQSGGNQGELVNAVVLCPPYIKAADCADCIKKSAQLLKRDCPKKKEAVVFTLVSDLTSCTVRYGDYKIEGKYDPWARASFQSPKKGANDLQLRGTFRNAFDQMRKTAVTGANGIRFAKLSTNYGNTRRPIYFTLQCTPDISQEDCKDCLYWAGHGLENIPIDEGKMSGRSVSTHCYARYSHDPFFPDKY
uniref:cysteine-rich receptor-like protein kinase 29 n=1 Tax=Erigeron canadensis TaxID=72917 RepID=UPI001CB967C2|nr:cysteine-rich receptor-like protein kinase 29 [Erigeron canadensis]